MYSNVYQCFNVKIFLGFLVSFLHPGIISIADESTTVSYAYAIPLPAHKN